MWNEGNLKMQLLSLASLNLRNNETDMRPRMGKTSRRTFVKTWLVTKQPEGEKIRILH